LSYFVIKKLPKVNSHPIGENSLNLVTLDAKKCMGCWIYQFQLLAPANPLLFLLSAGQRPELRQDFLRLLAPFPAPFLLDVGVGRRDVAVLPAIFWRIK
jgi:hypothetical protein